MGLARNVTKQNATAHTIDSRAFSAVKLCTFMNCGSCFSESHLKRKFVCSVYFDISKDLSSWEFILPEVCRGTGDCSCSKEISV